MPQPAILTDNLTRIFGRIRAVDGLSIEVPAGIIFGFLGPNASGKTTTISLLLGLIEATEGKATVLGYDVGNHANEVRARSGALLEHPGVYEQLTAEDNLEFYARVWRMPATDRETRIKELLTQMGLWERRGERVVQWSRGMKQKLALARALLHRPPLVFLDEPTAGLDVVSATALRDDLAGLTSHEGVTVFLTTHNMSEAERLCHQVAVIRQGKLLAVGNPDELRARAGSPRVDVVGGPFSQPVLDMLRTRPEVSSTEVQDRHLTIYLTQQMETAPLVSLLVGAGVQVEEVRKGKASLEEVFLTLMEEER